MAKNLQPAFNRGERRRTVLSKTATIPHIKTLVTKCSAASQGQGAI